MEIEIPKSVLPKQGHYVQHVLESGHIPGVLSGAELKGKAKSYGAHYARQRLRACEIARSYGIKSAIVHRARVWTLDGSPVKIEIV